MRADLAYRSTSHLGEGPVWDEEGHRLLWVNITAGELHAFDPVSGGDRVIWRQDGAVAAVALATTGELVLALRDRVIALDEASGIVRPLARLPLDRSSRCNDGGVDPDGRFIIGTTAGHLTPGTASLYRLEHDGTVTTLLTGLGLSNGMCWDASGRTMYFIDSLSRSIGAFAYPGDSGPLGPPTRTIPIPMEAGIPDGMTIDADDTLWVALWGGSAIWQLSPDGDLLGTIDLPVSQPTSVAFAGDGSHDLYMTSATELLSPGQLASEPLAGSLFRAPVPARGVGERRVRLQRDR